MGLAAHLSLVINISQIWNIKLISLTKNGTEPEDQKLRVKHASDLLNMLSKNDNTICTKVKILGNITNEPYRGFHKPNLTNYDALQTERAKLEVILTI